MSEHTAKYRDRSGWQDIGGYSRAVRRGSMIMVSGTTAHAPDGEALFEGDTYAQTNWCIDLVVAAVEKLGGCIEDIVRTRVLLAPGASWRYATQAHGERFAQVQPANSMYYVAGLIGSGFLVEVEAEAIVDI
jgi:enamine deaminase RidA (YjgF/YER057c/UK114 family)